MLKMGSFSRLASMNVVVQAFGTALAVLLQLLLARLLGPHEFGYFAYAVNWALLLATVSNVGMDSASMRFVAAFRMAGDDVRLRAFLHLATRVVLTGVAAAALAAAASAWMTGEPARLARWLLYPVPVVLMALLAFSVLFQSQLLGAERSLSALGPDKIARPLVTVVLVAIAVYAWPGALDAFAALVATTLAAAVSLFLLFVVRRALLGPVEDPAPATTEVESRDWLFAALAVYLVGLSQLVLTRGGVVAVGLLMGATDAGLFSVVVILAGLVFFVLGAANGAIAPRISSLYEAGERAGLHAMAVHYTWLFMILAVPVALVLVIFARPILALFGPAFLTAVPALQVMVLGQLIMVMGGPVGGLLTMTRHQRPAAVAVAVLALLYVGLNVLWIPAHGLTGAAWSLTVVIVLRTVWLTALVWWYLRITPPLLMPLVWLHRRRA
jgi:O-antigen/teichoic acid export membrane protein